MNKTMFGALVVCAFTASSAQAALVDRGGGLIYDNVLNITWLKDANYAQTSAYDSDGKMTWAAANTWAANLSYFDSVRGVTYDDWRLPTVGPIGSAFNSAFRNNGTSDFGYGNTNQNAELAYMYYVNLGNLGRCTPNDSDPSSCALQTGRGLTNTGPFTNLQANVYWSGTSFGGDAWLFDASDGYQGVGGTANGWYAWAVRPGDVSPVPLPAAAWLLLSGLGGLGLLGRRKTA